MNSDRITNELHHAIEVAGLEVRATLHPSSLRGETMKTLHNWALSSESAEKQHAAGRYNPARQVVIDDGPTLTIGAGSGDSVDVFTEHGRLLFVVSVNSGLGYCGLEVFDKNGGTVGNCFLQSDEQVKELLGPRGVDLSPMAIAKRLANYAGV